jgi:hypothetical protein
VVNRPIGVIQVSVNAVVQDESAILIDRHGRQLSSRKRLSDLEGVLDPSVITRWEWLLTSQRMKNCLSTRSSGRMKTPWEKRTHSLAKSFRLRVYFPPTETRRKQRFERYSTQTWRDACRRLWEQGHNRLRRHSRGGWVRWAHTVSNNHNKKKGGRYARARYCDRQADHGTD